MTLALAVVAKNTNIAVAAASKITNTFFRIAKTLEYKEALVLVSAALGLSAAFHFSFFSFFAFIFLLPPIFLVVRRQKAFLYFWLFGFLHYLFSLFWLVKVTKLGFFCLALYLGFFWGLFGFFLLRWRLWQRVFLPAFLWVVVEYLRSYLLWGGFPWMLIAYTQYRNLPFIQAADLLGAEFISFLVISFNFLLFNWFWLKRQKTAAFFKSKKALLLKSCILLFLFALAFFYGFLRQQQHFPSTGSLKVRVFQPNGKNNAGYFAKLSQIKRIKLWLAKYPGNSDLAVFPEAAFPFVVSGKDLPDFLSSAAFSLVLGALREEKGNVYNSFFLVSPSRLQPEVYDKTKLVPFGEYVPGGNIFHFLKALNEINNMKAGKIKLLSYKKAKIGPLVCFEDIFPLLLAKEEAQGANLFINITDESWFGTKQEMIQHLQAAVFRAVEEKRFLVRAANSGISCVIGPKGEIQDFSRRLKNVNCQDTFAAKIFLYSFPTVYSKIKDLFVLFSFSVMLVYLIGKRRRLWR